MDRRYYRLKALVVILGIAIAVVSSFVGAPRLASPTAHIHYSAAASVQSAMTETTLRLSHAIGNFVRHSSCIIRF